MLHFPHVLVSNFVCLLFDALQVVYTGFSSYQTIDDEKTIKVR